MTNVFGEPTDIDSNEKIILFYSDLGNEYFGFFDPNDYGSGNNMEILYMNCGISDYGYPPNSEEMMSTMAHEFQHLINFGSRLTSGKSEMAVWLDEGLAVSAEHYISNSAREIYVDVMVNDEGEKIRNGYPLTYFDYDDNGESYALAYTFMQYCKNQYPQKELLFKNLINHQYGDYRALVEIINESNDEYTTFEDIVVGYKIANMINGSGIYGYGDDRNIFDFTTSNAVKGPTERFVGYISGGGAVYYSTDIGYLKEFQPSGEGENIVFYLINAEQILSLIHI
eukprot:TRINITY_DN18209_c0_g1_i1.p1 TRINITY_DN18209_c0_g1~~TRINITY_DN18209_c0_g1_i1.p1  ORF type:complete len:283 (+),score=28.37 TRINITY_DN18209_c0_g1_i1:127-975(+)